jgi:hypothetical protein
LLWGYTNGEKQQATLTGEKLIPIFIYFYKGTFKFNHHTLGLHT